MPLAKDVLRLTTDLAVAGGEFMLSRVSRGKLSQRARRGNDLPVLLLPGYGAGDGAMEFLRDFLNDAGFDAHTWGLGQNIAFEGDSGQAAVEAWTVRIIERVRELSATSGGRKVALVGHSMGGLLSRETAARYPEEIDRVITMGSPTIHPYISDDQNSLIVKLASNKGEEGARFCITGKQGFLHWDAKYPKLPCIAIWSPIDAVVFSQSSRIPDYIVQMSGAPAIRENVRLVCSHAGMAFNDPALLAVADRLAQPVDDWQPFDAHRYFPRWAIDLIEGTFGSRLYHEFVYSDWRDEPIEARPEIREIDPDQPDLLRRLRRDHNDFYQLYAMVEESIENGSFGSESDYLLLADVARFMTDYLDRRHHPLEEFVFQQVLKFHPQSAKNLEMLAAEHERIAKEGAQLLKQVEHASDPRNKRQPSRLLARWRRFCETLRHHVELEEEVLFPQAEKHIPERAWAIVQRDWNRKTGNGHSPLSDEGAGQEFRHLFEYLSYVASRDQSAAGLGDNTLFGNYLDAMVFATEKLDALLERPSSPGK